MQSTFQSDDSLEALMLRGILVRLLLLCLTLIAMPTALRADTVMTLDDIEFWVGSGANRAGFVIDWKTPDASDSDRFAWGYRWDGFATGEDMFRAVIAEDQRLFAKIGAAGGFGVPVFGIGYDDGDGVFGITGGSIFDSDGTTTTNTSDADGSVATDTDDFYSEGWNTGFWNYYVSDEADPFDGIDDDMSGNADWDVSGSGISGRNLTHNTWDGFAFAPGFVGTPPSIPVAAVIPEPGSFALLAISSIALASLRRSPQRHKPKQTA